MPALLVVLVVAAGVMGLIIGSFLNAVAYRLPEGISLLRESRCPTCDARVRPWQNIPVISWLALGGRCAHCRQRISPRYPLVEAGTAAAFALVAWWFLAGPGSDGFLALIEPAAAYGALATVIAFAYFTAITIVLVLIDLDVRRLPDAIVLPAYLVAPALLAAACYAGGDWWPLARAGIGLAAMLVFYGLLRLIRPDGMGGGDVKLAGVLGIYLGYLGWGSLAVGAFAGFFLGGVFGLILIAARRAGRRSAIPFGPWMLAGAWVGVFAGEPLAQWYTGMFVLS